MATEIESIGKTLLDAPLGFVEQTISEIIKKPVYLKVVEQNSVFETSYVRKVVIGHSQFPILSAVVKFDSKNLTQAVMTGLLQKKESIGSILRKNNIRAERGSININFDPDKKTVTRNYEILHNGSVWFRISEVIRLDFLRACKDS
jgi:chorismate-pyruvate lyase